MSDTLRLGEREAERDEGREPGLRRKERQRVEELKCENIVLRPCWDLTICLRAI